MSGGEEERVLELDGREVEISRPEKILFPDAGLTKSDLVEYYRKVADRMLPHLRHRPLTLQRFPDGIDEEGFYQKEIGDHFPDWIERLEVEKKEGGTVTQVVCGDAATLVYLADQAAVTLHTWLSREDRLQRPDRIVFDLDPPESGKGGFDLVRAGARAYRELLEELGLAPFVMTTGSRGLHVTVPIERRQDFDEVRELARDASELLARRDPERFTTARSKEERGGRLFLDYLRNAYGQTGVAPYAVRARPEAPVATPLDWNELYDGELGPRSYTVDNLFRRLGQKEDPWRDIESDARALGDAREQLGSYE